MSYLDQLRQIRSSWTRADPPAIDDGPLVDLRPGWDAVRLYSRLAGRELWIARDRRAADDVRANWPGMPVLLLEEIPRLEGKPPPLLRAILETKAEFTDAELRG